jgi:hypothetical protein
MTKQEQQQPQDTPQTKCEGCGGSNMFDTPIADPKTSLTYHLH